MASNSPGNMNILNPVYKYAVGIMPQIETQNPETEEHCYASLYKVLQEYDTSAVLINDFSKKLDIKLCGIEFSYTRGDHFVITKFLSKSRVQIQKLAFCVKDKTVSSFMTEYFSSVGLNVALGLGVEDKVEILAVELENTRTPQKSIKEHTSLTMEDEQKPQLNMSSAEILLLSAFEDKDELVLISTEMNQSHGNVYNGEKNNLEVLTNEQCRFMFRFEKQDIDRLRVALGIPPKIVCNNGTVASGIEGLCIVLRRLSYPNRLEDISPIFQRPLYELSYILSKTLDIIYDNTSQKLTSLDQEWLSEEYLRTFAEVIHERGSPLLNCWGFIDGTVMPICRPTRHQRIVYSGHKRVHGLKFQSVVPIQSQKASLKPHG